MGASTKFSSVRLNFISLMITKLVFSLMATIFRANTACGEIKFDLTLKTWGDDQKMIDSVL